MALRGTLTHRKTRRLARALGIPPCFALGLCEALWHVAGEQAPAGDVGRMTNADIAMEMFYDGDPDALVSALHEAELLDKHDTHRWIVHDWHIHSDDATDNRLARAGKRYANGAQPRMVRLNVQERAKLCALHGYSVRTYAHKTPLPEPVPVPEPDPVPVPEPVPEKQIQKQNQQHAASVSALEVAQGVIHEAGVAARDLLPALEIVCAAEMHSGRDPTELRDAMVAAWRDYASKRELMAKPWGALNFFGEGHWKSPATWRLKKESPPPELPPPKLPLRPLAERLREEQTQ